MEGVSTYVHESADNNNDVLFPPGRTKATPHRTTQSCVIYTLSTPSKVWVT